MHPILFQIGPIQIYSFGLMISLGFTLAVLVSFLNAKRHGVDPWNIVDMALYLFLGGLIGSRLLYVFLNWSDYAGGPIWRLLATWEGGVSFYGAIGGGFLAAAWFTRRHKMSLARVADTVAPGLAIAAAVGRIGCLLNGCCYGLPSSGFFGVFTRFAPGLRHPTQLYEAGAYFLVFILLLWWQRRYTRVPGQLFLTFIWAYLIGRYGVEFLRADGYRIYPWLTLTQAASLVIAAVAIAVYIYLGRRHEKTVEAVEAVEGPTGAAPVEAAAAAADEPPAPPAPAAPAGTDTAAPGGTD